MKYLEAATVQFIQMIMLYIIFKLCGIPLMLIYGFGYVAYTLERLRQENELDK